MKNLLLKKKAFKKSKKGTYPEEIREYLNNIKAKTYKTPIEKTRFVVFDTETTGLDIRKDEIISIGAVVVENMKLSVGHSLEVLVHNVSAGCKDAIATHHIFRNELKENGLQEKEALHQFLNFIRGDVLVAHFAEFDMHMISRLMKKHYQIPCFNPSIDTIRLTKRFDRRYTNVSNFPKGTFTLDTLCQQYNIKVSIRHNAAGDALATAELLQLMLYRAKKRGVKTLAELLK